MKYYIFTLLVFGLLTSCKKETPNFTISGTIHDNSFSTGLKNAEIKLYEIEIGTTKEKLILTSSSDNNGNYSLNFERNKVEKYILKINKDNYFEKTETILFSSLTTNDDNIKNYSVDAKAWVNLHFTNTDQDLSKSIEYGITSGKSDCDECCTPTKQKLTNTLEENIICINNGNSTYSVLIISETLKTYTITTTPFDTVTLEIPF